MAINIQLALIFSHPLLIAFPYKDNKRKAWASRATVGVRSSSDDVFLCTYHTLQRRMSKKRASKEWNGQVDDGLHLLRIMMAKILIMPLVLRNSLPSRVRRVLPQHAPPQLLRKPMPTMAH